MTYKQSYTYEPALEAGMGIKTPTRRRFLAGAVGATMTSPVHAADWPSRHLTWVVPFPPGSDADRFVQPLAARVYGSVGQEIKIDHRAGFGGALGTTVVAIASPDGYQMLVGDTGLCYAPQIYPQASADLATHFVPVSAFARMPLALVVNPARLAAGDLGQFIAMARQSPSTIVIASTGVGTVSHLAISLLEVRATIKLKHEARRGRAAAWQALVSGEAAAMLAPIGSIMEHVNADKLRVVAIASKRREPLLPTVPTFAEAALPDFRVSTWYGLFAPRGTPDPILNRMHDAVQIALEDVRVKRVWRDAGAKVELESREQFAQFVQKEIAVWRQIALAANVRLE